MTFFPGVLSVVCASVLSFVALGVLNLDSDAKSYADPKSSSSSEKLRMTRLQTIYLPTQTFSVTDIAINDATRKAYSLGFDDLDVVDISTGLFSQAIPLPNKGLRIGVAQYLQKVYITAPQNLQVMNPNTYAISTIAIGEGTDALAIDQVRHTVYTAVQSTDNSIGVIDAQTDTLTKTISVAEAFPEWTGISVDDIVIDEARNILYAVVSGNIGGGERNSGLAIIDPTSDDVSSVPEENSLTSIMDVEYDSTTNLIYVLGGNEILAIDAMSKQIAKTIPLSNDESFNANHFALDSVFGMLYITGAPAEVPTLMAIDIQNSATFAVQNQASGYITIDSATRRVYVADGYAFQVYSPAQYSSRA